MIPKTEIRFSLRHNIRFNKKFSEKSLQKLKKNSKKFIMLYKKYINNILKSIEKYGSKKWEYDFIPIYIIGRKGISYSDPLTIKFRDNEKLMLIILIHELLHNNVFVKDKFKNRAEMHLYMESLIKKIVKDINVNLDKELNQFIKMGREWHNLK